MTKPKAKATKKSAKQPKRIALVSAFADLPAANLVLAQHGMPAKLASRGFYCVADGQPIALFENHPERALPAKVGEAGLELLRDLARWARDPVGALLGDFELDLGFHAELDARALAKAFEADGFRVVPFPVAACASSFLLDAKEPWPLAHALLAAGDVDVGELLGTLCVNDHLTSPPDDLLSLLADRLEGTDELMTLTRLLQNAKADLVACALPWVMRTWKPPKAKTRPRGLPPELATLLGAFEGVPALGVMTATKVAAERIRLVKLATGAPKPDWGSRDPAIRIDRYWREGWIPFCLRPDDQYLAIDLDPTAQGRKGQIIGVRLNPPQLSRYRSTLGEWLWNELDTSWRGRSRTSRARSRRR